MADQADLAFAVADALVANALAGIVADLPVGTKGQCEDCGENMPRLIGGLCGFCRDGRRPPLSFYAERAATPPAPASTTKEHAPMTQTAPQITSRKIEFTDAAAVAIENRADGAGISYKQAAAELIDIAVAYLAAQEERIAHPPLSGGVLSIADTDELFAELRARFEIAQSNAVIEADLQAATARAEAAEQKLHAMKGLLGA